MHQFTFFRSAAIASIFLFGFPAFASPASFAKKEARAEPEIRGYRLIRASPREFASAISAAYAPPKEIAGQAPQSTSRLEKYFRIKKKTVEGRSVTLEIIPNVPLLGSLFEDTSFITVKTTLRNQTESSYLYDVKFKAKLDVSATMLVEPHPLGSLLTITADEPTTKAVLASTIFKTILAMGFLTEQPAQTIVE